MLAKTAAPNSPATAATGKGQCEWLVFTRLEAFGQAKLGRFSAQQFVDRLGEQVLPGAINQTQPSVGIEREHRYVDLGHDGAQERGRFERAEALHPQRLAQCIDLEQHLAERVVCARAARPNRVIAFAQRGEQIAHRLQRMHDVVARRRNESGRANDDHDGERPLHFRAEIAKP